MTSSTDAADEGRLRRGSLALAGSTALVVAGSRPERLLAQLVLPVALVGFVLSLLLPRSPLMRR